MDDTKSPVYHTPVLGKLFVGGFIPVFNYLPVIQRVQQNNVYPYSDRTRIHSPVYAYEATLISTRRHEIGHSQF